MSATAATVGAMEPAPVKSSKLGMWLFLSGEVLVFGGFIACFLLYRFATPSWHEAAHHLSVAIGTINTIVLLSSSYTMVLAHQAAEDRDGQAARRWLWATILLGLVFCGIKSYEWSVKFQHHLFPWSGRFWSFYFTMTGLHALHLLVGVIILATLALSSPARLGGRLARRVEAGGLYWHFVDVVWIFLFPLFYLG